MAPCSGPTLLRPPPLPPLPAPARHRTADRAAHGRLLGPAGPPPLEDRAHRRVAGRVAAATDPLRALLRAVLRAGDAGLLGHLLQRPMAAPEDQQPGRSPPLLDPAADPRDQGPGSKAVGLAMALKLLEVARTAGGATSGPTWSRWCAAARSGKGGVVVQRPDQAQELAARPCRTGDPQPLTVPRLRVR